MRNCAHRIPLLGLILFGLSPAGGTPNPAIWVREILLGYDDAHYYVYRIERNYPANYYSYSESASVLKKEIRTGEVKEEVVLRRTTFQDRSLKGDWVRRDEIRPGESAEEFLVRHRATSAFPAWNLARGSTIVVGAEGIFLQEERRRVLLKPMAEVERHLRGSAAARVTSYVEGSHYSFLQVESGIRERKMDFYQAVVPLENVALDRARHTLSTGGGELLPSSERDNAAYWTATNNQTLTGTCSLEISPDRALIEGGVSAEGLKPSDTVEELNREIEAIRTAVAEAGGTLRLNEVVRAVRPRPDRGSEPKFLPLPFLVAQRLRVELPLEADVDAVLERLLQAGFDRYGRDFRLEYTRSDATVIVHYAFSDLSAHLEELRQRCFADAIESWCQSRFGPGEAAACTEALASERSRFRILFMEGVSRPLPGPEAGLRRYQFSYTPRDQTEEVRLAGKTPLQLDGSIRVMFYYPPQE